MVVAIVNHVCVGRQVASHRNHEAHKSHCDADFPMFEWDEEEQRLQAMHHPFTAPNQDDLAAANGAGLREARALAYDLVYNGVEVAGMLASCLEHFHSMNICLSPCSGK